MYPSTWESAVSSRKHGECRAGKLHQSADKFGRGEHAGETGGACRSELLRGQEPLRQRPCVAHRHARCLKHEAICRHGSGKCTHQYALQLFQTKIHNKYALIWIRTRFQPIFIIHSGYPTYDIERTCSQKGIHAYSYFILDKEIDLAEEIGNIANEEETKLKKHLYYSFSEANVNVAIDIMNKNAMQYISDEKYKEVNNELAQLFSDLNKIPKRFREKFRRYAELQLENHMLECSYMYQYLKDKINK